MKNLLRKSLVMAAFCGAGALMSCGTEADTEQPQLSSLTEALVQVDEAQAADEEWAPGGGQTSAACKKINARMSKDGRAMARTKAFKAMIRTQAYKDLAKDIVEMKRKGCSMSPGGGDGGDEGGNGGGLDFECLSLQIQAYQHQQALMQTSEYKRLEKTRAFKRLQADIEEAQKNGCIKMLTGMVDAL